jgi:hypothetical protein
MTKKEVVSSYVLNEDVLSFNVAPHDGVVVIDPTIDWSTYFGGSSLEYGYTVATDTGGSSYMAGHTSSSSGIATSGAFSTTYNGNNDAYLVKFDKYGSLQWATYYGGSASDNFFYVATDSLGNIYASGVTASSSGITTTGAYQTTYGGGY